MNELTKVRIFFRDESVPEIILPLSDEGNGLYSLGFEQEVKLPNEEIIKVYAEVRPNEKPVDITITVIHGDRELDIRCGAGVIVSYQTIEGIDVLIQIGTGAWE